MAGEACTGALMTGLAGEASQGEGRRRVFIFGVLSVAPARPRRRRGCIRPRIPRRVGREARFHAIEFTFNHETTLAQWGEKVLLVGEALY